MKEKEGVTIHPNKLRKLLVHLKVVITASSLDHIHPRTAMTQRELFSGKFSSLHDLFTHSV